MQQSGKCRLIICRPFYGDVALCRVEGLIAGRVCVLTFPLWPPLRSSCPPKRGPPSHGSVLTRAFLDRKATKPPGPELSLGYAVLQCNSEIKPLTQGTLAELQLPRLKAISASSHTAGTPQRRAGGSTVTGGPSNPDINN